MSFLTHMIMCMLFCGPCLTIPLFSSPICGCDTTEKLAMDVDPNNDSGVKAATPDSRVAHNVLSV